MATLTRNDAAGSKTPARITTSGEPRGSCRSCIAGNGVNRGNGIPAPFSALKAFRHYLGAKGGAGVYQAIISQIPPHTTFIEAFVGSGQVTQHKLPATSTIAIDVDAAVARAWSRVPAVSAVCGDAISFLEARTWTGGEVVYCDPPYLLSVRSCRRNYYRHEFSTPAEHTRLLRVLKKIPVPVLISGYASMLYDRELAGWRSISYQTVNRAGNLVREFLWMNFPEPVALHDYRYLGTGFRERHRIKKKKTRWKARLWKMPVLERMAVLSAVAEVIQEGSPKTRPLVPASPSRGSV